MRCADRVLSCGILPSAEAGFGHGGKAALLAVERRVGQREIGCRLALATQRCGVVIDRMLPRLILGVCFLGCASVGLAVERVLRIEAPAEAVADESVAVALVAGTKAGAHEQVGLLHVDVSRDGGGTWEGLRYLDNLGAETRQEFSLKMGPVGSVLVLRARVAFRGGLAGDVDVTGAAIRWHDVWADWLEPTTRRGVIRARERGSVGGL